jgi:seryl-tRNA synthetase
MKKNNEFKQDNPNAVSEDKAVLEVRKGITVISGEVKQLKIDSEESQKTASSFRSQIKELQKRLKARLEYFIGPAKAYVKSISSVFGLYKTELDTTDEILEGKMIAFQEAQEAEAERIADEQEKKNQELLRKGKPPLPAPAIPVENSVRTKDGQTIFLKHWTYIIENPDEVPREYCSPDDQLLVQAVQQGIREIRGVRIFIETRTIRK